MLKVRLILGTLLLILMPFSSYAEEPGIIGSNLGLDFYSRIDDAGDALAQGMVQRRLGEKRTYGSLGCGASWIADISIDQNSLKALASGNTAILVQLAVIKNVNLTTTSESGLRQCLVEKYTEMQRIAYQDQDALEIVGNIGLYMDGDTINSDYDLIADITRINAIIFKEKYEYTGAKNASAKSIASLLRGDPIIPLYALVGNMAPPSGVTSISGSSATGSTIPGPTTTTPSPSSTLPWALECSLT